MIVNFNPNVSKKMNTPKLAKNNNPNVAFKRNFNQKEIDGLVACKAEIYNNIMFAIGIKLIRAQDGAAKKIQELLAANPNNRLIKQVAAKFAPV